MAILHEIQYEARSLSVFPYHSLRRWINYETEDSESGKWWGKDYEAEKGLITNNKHKHNQRPRKLLLEILEYQIALAWN